MPKAKNPLSPAEQRKLFEEEVKKRKKAGEFDTDSADAALDELVKRSAKGSDSPTIQEGRDK